ERRPARLVLPELEAREQPAPAHIADVRQRPERREPLVQHRAHPGAALDQLVPLEVTDRGEPRGARHGMVREGLRVQEVSRAAGDHVEYPLRGGDGRERRIPPEIPLPSVIVSGATPYGSIA